ncbi:hypothetical protein B0H13DRAFT_2309633 [Mycena leptocephala]|nr:hypothetical protein B0H13DRAFT_2309633 [Mycena leptocephala]
MPRRASSDLLHACHRELLPPWRGLPSLLLLPSSYFTLMSTRLSPSLLPSTPYLRVPQITIPTSLERLGVRDSGVLDRKWWRYLRGDALQFLSPRFPGASQHGIAREERRRAFSLLLAPLLRWVVDVPLRWQAHARNPSTFRGPLLLPLSLVLLSSLLLSSLLLSTLSSPRSPP